MQLFQEAFALFDGAVRRGDCANFLYFVSALLSCSAFIAEPLAGGVLPSFPSAFVCGE
jgi:hypothetical protein